MTVVAQSLPADPTAGVRLFRWLSRNGTGIGVILGLILLWELAVQTGIANPMFSSSPSRIWLAGVELARDGTLWRNTVASGQVFLAGFGLAILVGVPIGVVIGWYDWANRAFSPLVSAFYTTPRIAMMPLFIIWFGLGFGSKLALVFLSAIFPLIVNMQVAMQNTDADLKRVGQAYGATQWQLFRTIALPASVPFLLTGLRLAMGRALLGVVAAEVFGGGQGIGFMIEYAGATFRIDVVFVGVFIIAAFGIIMDRSIYALSRRLDAWRGVA
ncbi:ABC transporter permease [Aureimonas fodinaquatilis]|uniref:ABC transporter permease n=1 Tax=Aureimonas fodinaquatilis TaxID=2565783 RepID=A0A5B0DYG4_9HYPH|nr:ABC transporter permease [Aureimonas fodinaquatilis]KAA0970895.1 ABC transporter permease [Aureimonas fodinaquatilis]